MTNLTETSAWDAGVYQFATTDPVQGGPGGIDNQPHQSLTDRTLWLRNRIAAAIIQSGQADGTSDNQQLVEAIVLQVASVPALRLTPIPLVPSGQTVLVLTRGQAADGDGYAATYKWVSASTAVDDGKSIVTPASNPGSGRWLVCGINASALGGQAASYYATTAAVAAAIAPLAPVASPALTGTPTAPTPPANDASAKVANTQWVASNFIANTGVALVWNSNPNTYYKVATLPASTASTADSISIKATLNSGYAAANDTMLDGIFGNRGGFSYVYNLFGPNNPATSIRCYAETNGTTSVYALSTLSFAFVTLTILNAGISGITGPAPILYPVPAPTTTPTGTLIFNSAAPTIYPPFLNVSSPLSYLTPTVAAATYLPLAGGTLTGPLTIAGADVHVYRPGGTTGAIYFNSAASAYVFYDGTNLDIVAPGGSLTVNGAVMATQAQYIAADAATLSSAQSYANAAAANAQATAETYAAAQAAAAAANAQATAETYAAAQAAAAQATAETYANGTSLLAPHGWRVLPGGLIENWGYWVAGGINQYAITFLKPYTSAATIYSLQATLGRVTGDVVTGTVGATVTSGSAGVAYTSANNVGGTWHALGT